MEVLHKAEKPGSLILACLLETVPGRTSLLRVRDLVLLHALVSKLLLALCEPASREGSVGEHEEAENGYEGGDGAFNDEKPGVVSC